MERSNLPSAARLPAPAHDPGTQASSGNRPGRDAREGRGRSCGGAPSGPLGGPRRWESHRVGGCCDPRGRDRMFGARFARSRAAAYRRRGLDKTAQVIVGLLEQAGVAGATVLEIGGGAGEIQLELLGRGAASAMNLELSPGYEREAAALIAEAGVTGRVQRRLADIAADPAAVPSADIVVLHRVVCCYPDYAKLLGAAAEHARRQLVFSYPPRNGVSR